MSPAHRTPYGFESSAGNKNHSPGTPGYKGKRRMEDKPIQAKKDDKKGDKK